MTVTLTTTVPCVRRIREILVDSPDDFDSTKMRVEDAVEPLNIRASQVYDYDNAFHVGDTPDATFSIFSVSFTADAAGATSHVIATDPSVTRVVYEPTSVRRRSTTPPAAVAPTDVVYIWCSDNDRFPD
jgi:hypothetical protein